MTKKITSFSDSKLFESAFEYAAIGMALVSLEGQFIHVNQSLCEMLEYTEAELKKLDFQSITHPDDLDKDLSYVKQMLAKEIDSYQMEKRYFSKSGKTIWILLSVSLVLDEAEKPYVFISQIQDISVRKEVENKLFEQYKLIAFQTSHDPLTNLSNRDSFYFTSHNAIEYAKEHKGKVALLLFDVDKFKYINETYGHPMGDELLQAIARRVQDFCRKNDFWFGRLGGDEFAILLQTIPDFAFPGKVADQVLACFKRPFKLSNSTHEVSISLGISCYPDITQSAEDLLKNADIALYKVKQKGGKSYQYFSEALQKEHDQVTKLRKDFSEALVNHELVLFYQPIIDINSNQVISVEALIRWQKAKETLLTPDKFLPVIESTDLMVSLRDYVIDEACEAIKVLTDKFDKPPRISVNFSPHQLLQTKTDMVVSKLETMKIQPEYLAIEITETALMGNVKQAQMKLQQLRDYGITIMIDDFGTGFSSLSLLYDLPCDVLKIDKSFIDKSIQNKKASSMIKGIINLANSLNIPVIAEGVEQKEQLIFLQAIGCQYVQGHLFAKAMPFASLLTYLNNHSN